MESESFIREDNSLVSFISPPEHAEAVQEYGHKLLEAHSNGKIKPDELKAEVFSRQTAAIIGQMFKNANFSPDTVVKNYYLKKEEYDALDKEAFSTSMTNFINTLKNAQGTFAFVLCMNVYCSGGGKKSKSQIITESLIDFLSRGDIALLKSTNDDQGPPPDSTF